MAKAKAKAGKAKPDAGLAKDVEAKALAQFQAETPPWAQAGLFDGKFAETLKKVVKEITPGIVKGALLAGMDGAVTPGEVVNIVAEAARKIIALGESPAGNTGAPEPREDHGPDLSQAPA
jgi:hypothetical protein